MEGNLDGTEEYGLYGELYGELCVSQFGAFSNGLLSYWFRGTGYMSTSFSAK
jgi:hypothetical protein